MFKHCFELTNDTRTWIIASKSEQDLLQWFSTIYNQIEQVSKRIAMHKKNLAIVAKEVEKSKLDMAVLEKLIKPSTVMFDPLQKGMLIGFFTGRDLFLNKLIPLLSVYLE